MSTNGNHPKYISVNYIPQSADPANPREGDVHRSDGTARDEGLWEFIGGVWDQLNLLPAPKVEEIKFDTVSTTFSTVNVAIPSYVNETFNSLSVLATRSNNTTNGCEITMLKKCKMYTSAYMDHSGSGDHVGIAINAVGTELTNIGAFVTMSHTKRICEGNTQTNGETFSGFRILEIGDILRPHKNNTITTTDQNGNWYFHVMLEEIQ